MKQLLITGGFGKIGNYFTEKYKENYRIKLVDIKIQEKIYSDNIESYEIDLTNSDIDQEIFKNVDVVIHLAGIANPEANFDQVLNANIIATKNVFESAINSGCKKIIFASSAQTIEGYNEDIQVNKNMHVKPKNLYGVSKCFGEALGAFYSFKTGISVICLRIGAYEFPQDFTEMNARDLSAFLHPDDFNQLLQKCIEIKNIDFEIFNVISNNRYKRLDISESIAKLGYEPKADSFELFKLKK